MTNSLTVLGSSSGLPSATRACSGHVLQVGESLNLIDCGGGVVSSFLRQGLDPLHLDRVFISHTHSDHVGDLALLIQLLHGVDSTRRLDIYLPRNFVDIFRSYLTGVYLVPERLKPNPVLHGYEDGFMLYDCFGLEAIGNNHLAGIAADYKQLGLPNDFQCHSFRVEVAGKRIFYTADIDGFADIKRHLHDLDLVLIEATHIQFGEFVEFAQKASVGRWLVTHVADEDVDRLSSLIERADVPNIEVAHDGLVIPL